MLALAFLSLGYAFEHLLVSVIVAGVVLASPRISAITVEARAGVLLFALMLCVAGPLLPLPQLSGGDVTAPVMAGETSAPASPYAAVNLSEAASNIEVSEPVAILLVALWIAGAAFKLGKHARGALQLRRIVAASRRARALEKCYRGILPEGVEVRLAASFGPAVVGVLRPKILIPGQLAAFLPEHALRAVLLHEASHVRRNDLLANAFQKIAEAVFWWNPLVGWIAKALDAAREIACDVQASRSCETPADYAEGLLVAIEHMAIPRQPRCASALSVSDSLQALDQRIDSIIEDRAPNSLANFAALSALLLLLAAFVTASEVSRPLAPVRAKLANGAAPTALEEMAVAKSVPTSLVPTMVEPQPQSKPPVAANGRDTVEAAYAGYVADVQVQHRGYTTAVEAKHREYVAVMQARHLEYTAISAARHREYIQTADAQHREYVETAGPAETGRSRELAAAMEKERREYNAATERERLEYAADSERERREHNGALEAERQQYTAEAERERREYDSALEAARRASAHVQRAG